jgi:hypothetical protein
VPLSLTFTSPLAEEPQMPESAPRSASLVVHGLRTPYREIGMLDAEEAVIRLPYADKPQSAAALLLLFLHRQRAVAGRQETAR